MFDFMDEFKRVVTLFFKAAMVLFFVSILVGGFFFRLDAITIASWFAFVTIAVFAIFLVVAILIALISGIVNFIEWLSREPRIIWWFLGALAVVIITVYVVMVIILKKPLLDLGAIINPIITKLYSLIPIK